jgi:phosphoenolpyruvate carboxykinase (ATP)
MSKGTEQVGSLIDVGIQEAAVHWNLAEAALYEAAVSRKEGVISAGGPLVCLTVPHTGRSPNDKFVVREPSSDTQINWGRVNREMAADHFDRLHADLTAWLKGREVFVQECSAGADEEYRLSIRVVNQLAWHNLFARNLFIPAAPGSVVGDGAPFTIIDAPGFKASPERHGTASDVVIALNFARRLILIAGTGYAGEMKKSVFTALNYLLPLRGVLSMHCSANIGASGDVALFFGLSGTGKTTLSSDPARRLIGDDEHGWSDRGIFNFEGGCYAKTIRLSAKDEPQIFAATGRFGTVLENVAIDPTTRTLDFDDDRHTENTRAAYPISFIDNAEPSGCGGHPKHIIMLTADAFGVLPPVARLSADAAMYHFLSGYTAKVAGTEKGVTEPKATFSSCFGSPFLPLAPGRYAAMLGEKIAAHAAQVWLLNTGWTGGPYGQGRRMPIRYTRAMIAAALAGRLDSVPCERDPVFNVDVPVSCPDVPGEMLRPRSTWGDTSAYDRQAARLARMFADNFKTFEADVAPGVRQAGPLVQGADAV